MNGYPVTSGYFGLRKVGRTKYVAVPLVIYEGENGEITETCWPLYEPECEMDIRYIRIGDKWKEISKEELELIKLFAKIVPESTIGVSGMITGYRHYTRQGRTI